MLYFKKIILKYACILFVLRHKCLISIKDLLGVTYTLDNH